MTLDGSGSSDGEGAVTYSWALTGDPDSTGIVPTNPTTAMPTFTAPQHSDHPDIHPDGDR